MDERQKRILEKLGLNEEQFEPNKAPSTIEITREDFELLDVEEDVMYHIIEEDGTITAKKGENR